MITQEPKRVFTRYTDRQFLGESLERYDRTVEKGLGFELRNMVTQENGEVKIKFVKKKKEGPGYEVQDFLLDTADYGLLKTILTDHEYPEEFADNVVNKAKPLYEQVRSSHDDDAPSNFRVSAYIPQGQEDMVVGITPVDLGEVGWKGKSRSEARAEKFSEVRLGGLVMSDPSEVAKMATAEGGIEKVHEGLQERGRSELQRIETEYDKGLESFLREAGNESDIAGFIVTPECAERLKGQDQFGGLAQVIGIQELYGKMLNAVLTPVAFADEVKFADAGKVLDQEKIKAQAAILGELIDNAKSPRIAILMNRPAQNQDAEQVLKMIGKLPIEQLIVLYQRGQPLGSLWRAAAQGRLTPVAVKGNDAVPSMAQKIVRSRDGQLMVSFWTQNFGAGNLGIYSVLAEINRIADPDLKSLALNAVHYAILRFASLDEKTRQAIIADPAKIKEYLDQSITALSFFRFGKSGLELVIDQFVNNYLAEKSIQAAA